MPPSYWNRCDLPSRSSSMRDDDAAVQEGQFPEALGQRVEAVLGGLENLRVRPERDLRAAARRRAGSLQSALRGAALVALLKHLAVAPDFQLQPLGQGVHDRHADAVQAARHLVAVVVELAAGVQDREHDLGRRFAAFMAIDRNAAAVVHDRDRVIDVDGDVDLVAIAGQRLVDRVVHDLVNEVVQSGRAGGPDVHRGPLAHRLETLEDLDLVGAVVGRVRLVATRTPGLRSLPEGKSDRSALIRDVPRVS